MPDKFTYQSQEIWNRVFDGTDKIRTGGMSTTAPAKFDRPTQTVLNLCFEQAPFAKLRMDA